VKKYFLSQDGDCHWYLVPAENRDEWYQWKELPSDDERSWEPPAYAKAVDGPELMEFYLDVRG
jgi:hypothetical protein